MFPEEEIEQVVRESYGALAQGGCCTSCGPSPMEALKQIGYAEEELQDLPAEVLNQ